MIETEWLSCEDPKPMMRFLVEGPLGRKLRLFGVACCQRITPHLLQLRSHVAIGVAEEFADGAASDEQLRRANSDAYRALHAIPSSGPEPEIGEPEYWAPNARTAQSKAADAVHMLTLTNPSATYWSAVRCAEAVWYAKQDQHESQLREHAAQCALLRDIFGNPFRPVAFAPEWRTDTSVAIARQMYESRDFGAMPILADALQDAGCDAEELLRHCRDAAQVHVRGCWAVDLVLGRE